MVYTNNSTYEESTQEAEGSFIYEGEGNFSENGFLNDTFEKEEPLAELYVWAVPVLLVACTAALLMNAHVLAAVCWIRRPLSRTLRLSVSLAAADALSSLCFGLGLFVNSVMTRGLSLTVPQCVYMVLEVLRLGTVVSAELHLLALACHHLMGILRPLQYPGDGCSRYVAGAALAALWLTPSMFFAGYFSAVSGQGFQTPDCIYNFMLFFKFRAVLGGIMMTPLVAMFFIYVRIFLIVRQLEDLRPRHHSVGGGGGGGGGGGACSAVGPFATMPAATAHTHASAYGNSHANPRAASLRSTVSGGRCSVRNGRLHGHATAHTAAHAAAHEAGNRQQRVARHVKAARTTLLIVGSCVMGWVPGLLVYLLVCVDCPVSVNPQEQKTTAMFFVYYIVNLLIILKTLLNPIIYAARMTEIKLAAKRMRQSCFGCGAGRRRSPPRSSSAGAGALGRAGTLVGYLRRSPLGDAGPCEYLAAPPPDGPPPPHRPLGFGAGRYYTPVDGDAFELAHVRGSIRHVSGRPPADTHAL